MTIPGRDTRWDRGFTLVELMVSVAVLAVMILGFSVVLSQSQRMVTGAQAIIDNNAKASAITQVIRQDFAAISKDGFLAIVAPGGPNGSSYPPQIVFTTVGHYTAISPDYAGIQADAAIICYRIRQDASHGNTPNVLCRETHLLTDPVAGGPAWDPAANDVTRMYLSYVAGLSRYDPAPNRYDIASELLANFLSYAPVPTLPANLQEMQATWPVLATDCPVADFQVHWLHSDPSDDEWYGFPGEDDPVNPYEGPGEDWQAKTVGYLEAGETGATDQIQGRHAAVPGGGNYVALWSHHNRENWPRAIRIRFTLGGTPVEIICRVLP